MPKRIQPLPISNSTFEQAEFVVVGVPDNSGSTYRGGAEEAPNAIRNVANLNEVGRTTRHGKRSVFNPGMSKLSANVHDAGNTTRSLMQNTIKKIVKGKKMPITIGGDHSITYGIMSAISPKKKFGVVYFDAHPDFISSKKEYFGSVLSDLSRMKNMDPKSSMLLGIRSNEDEEIDNIKKSGIKVLTATEIQGLGARKVAEIINDTVTGNTYLSVDVDVVDPAFAPGVSVPVPGGITANEMLYLVKSVAKRANLGFDVVEVCPRFDKNGITAYFAYKLILEFVSARA